MAHLPSPSPDERVRLRLVGAVQGVGFRPFVYRLARSLDLGGYVLNDPGGVTVELEGSARAIDEFRERVVRDRPPHSSPRVEAEVALAPQGDRTFEVRRSVPAGAPRATVLPDLALCDACRAELSTPGDRRYRHPFISCTACGPRFSIVERLPYDRPNTTMSGFALCAACAAEYADPGDRRFHAEPIACLECGPRVMLRARPGDAPLVGEEALAAAVTLLGEQRVVAVKGLGGFHLMVDATSDAAVERLRRRKGRSAKPFAIMAPDLEAVRRLCHCSPVEEALLAGAQAPIVLLRRRRSSFAPAPSAELLALGAAPAALTSAVVSGVAPGLRELGVMLPYTPLHALLLEAFGRPVVCTSGNRSDEPICTDERRAHEVLDGIADAFLVHDRPIARPVDDSVQVVVDGVPRFWRRARGAAPLSLTNPSPLPTALGLGAYQKVTVTLAVGHDLIVSQHVGDLATAAACLTHEALVADLLSLHEATPVLVAHDLHPDFPSTEVARELVAPDADSSWSGGPLRGRLLHARRVGVQHHHAHFAACLVDNGVDPLAEQPVDLGLVWDGAGYGTDGVSWGGEALLGGCAGALRVAHLRPFPLLGGDMAAREPRRAALAILFALRGEEAFDDEVLARLFTDRERVTLQQMLRTGVGTPLTTSMGRLFDGVAALLGLFPVVSYEGQAAAALEQLADPEQTEGYLIALTPREGPPELLGAHAPLTDVPPFELDWRPLVAGLLSDRRAGLDGATIAGRFHHSLAEAAVAVAARCGAPRVALSGGCFMNRLLHTRAASLLTAAGHEVLTHRRVPPNDGGVSVGQVAVAVASGARGDSP